jgi:hypothetical protein
MDSLYFDTFRSERPCTPDETDESTQSWYDGWEVPCGKCRTQRGKLCGRCHSVLRKRGGECIFSPELVSWKTQNHDSSNDTKTRGPRNLGFAKLVLPQSITISQCPDSDLSGSSSALAFDSGCEEEYSKLCESITYRNGLRDLGGKEDLDQDQDGFLAGDFRYRNYNPGYLDGCPEYCHCRSGYCDDDHLEYCHCRRSDARESDFWFTDMKTEAPLPQIMRDCLCYNFRQSEVLQRRPKLLYYGIGLGGVSGLWYGVGPCLRQPSPPHEVPGSRIWSIISTSIRWGYRGGARILGYDTEFQKALSELD